MNIMLMTNPTYCYYGYSIVGKNVAKGLKEAGHKVIVYGNVTMGAAVKDEYGTINLPMAFDAWGSDVLENYMRAYNIDILITIIDVWQPQVQYIPALCKKMKIPLICHTTIRSEPLSPKLAAFLKDVDYVVTPSLFGQRVAMSYPVIKHKVRYVPHGVDNSIFYPDPKMKKIMKKKLGYEDKFIFLCVGRNKGMQKNYPVLYHGYKNLMGNYPDAAIKSLLHIHTYPNEPNAVDLNLLKQIAMSNYVNNIRFTYVKPSDDWSGLVIDKEGNPNAIINQPNFGLPETEMAKLYNMADCMVMTTEGESFCLPVLESMACGVPQVFPNHTTGQELIGNPKSGLLCNIECRYTNPNITDVAFVSPDSVSKNMHHMLYATEKGYDTFSKNAINHAKNYEWKKIIPMWLKVIDEAKEKSNKFNYADGGLGL